MELIFGCVTGNKPRATKGTWYKFDIVSGSQKGEQIYITGKYFDSLPTLKRRAYLGLKGEWVDGPKKKVKGFEVEGIEDAILQATPEDLATVCSLTGIKLTEEQIRACLTAQGVPALYQCKFDSETIEKMVEAVGEETTEQFANMVKELIANNDILHLTYLLTESETGLDSIHAGDIYYALKNRAEDNLCTVTDLITGMPWLLVQCLPDNRIARDAALKIADFLGMAPELKSLLSCMGAIMSYVFEQERLGHSFVWEDDMWTQMGRRYRGQYNKDIVTQARNELCFGKTYNKTFGSLVRDGKPEVTEEAAIEIKAPFKRHTSKLLSLYLPGIFFSERTAAQILIDQCRFPVEPWKFNPIPSGLNRDQQRFIKAVEKKRFTVLTGEAGTGKTETLKNLIDLYYETYDDIPMVIAPTALAANRAAVDTSAEEYAQTAHRFARIIYDEIDLAIDGPVRTSPLKAIPKLVIFDECSMLGPVVLQKVLDQMGDDTRIVFAGDPWQLPPIGADGVFTALIDLAKNPNIPNFEWIGLTINYRSGWGVIRAAQNVRSGIPIEYCNSVKAVPVSNEAGAIDKIKEIIQGFDSDDYMVLAPTRSKTGGINALNHALQKEGEAIPGTDFCIGDPVIAKRNDYHDHRGITPSKIRMLRIPDRPDVFNGMRGTVDCYENDVVKITFRLGNKIVEAMYNPKELDYYIEMAYSITVHKAQGGQAKHIVFCIMTNMANRELIVTALTRCKSIGLSKGDVSIVSLPEFFGDNPPYVDQDWANKAAQGDIQPSRKTLSKLKYRVQLAFPNIPKGIVKGPKPVIQIISGTKKPIKARKGKPELTTV